MTSSDRAQTVPTRNALALAAVQEDRPMVAIVEEALALWMRQYGYEIGSNGGGGSVNEKTESSIRS